MNGLATYQYYAYFEKLLCISTEPSIRQYVNLRVIDCMCIPVTQQIFCSGIGIGIQWYAFDIVLFFLLVVLAFASPLENQAVLNDSKLQFVCHHNSTSKARWSYWPIGKKPKDAVIIPSNTSRTSRRIVTKADDQKQTILTIEPVHLDDAGTYECKILDTVIGKSVTLSESKFTANLVVLGMLNDIFFKSANFLYVDILVNDCSFKCCI